MISPDPVRVGAGLAELAPHYDLLLCDVWGVIHNGVTHHRGVVDALRRYRERGRVVLVTNAPVPAAQVRHRLDSLMVPRDAYDAIATSGDVTIAMIVAAGCPPLFSIGPDGEDIVYTEAARLGPRAPEIVAVEHAEMAICISPRGVDDAPEAYDASLAALKTRGLDLVCANPDIVVEVGDLLVYCAGAIAERYAAIGGGVIHAGKPFPAIYERALTLAGAAVPPSRVLAIGDALHTDIAGARRMGFDSFLVTTGIHRERLHGAERGAPLEAAALRALLAEKAIEPTFAAPRLVWSQPAGA